MPTTPSWSAAKSGLPNNLDAQMLAVQVAQELGTHAQTNVYPGNSILTSTNATSFQWSTLTGTGTANDHDQPFIMPGGKTTIGRVTLPILATGSGGDLRVSLCPDNGSGSPNVSSPIVTTIIPSNWLTSLSTVTRDPTDGEEIATESPLASTEFNSTGLTGLSSKTWNTPAVGPNGAAAFSAPVTSGSFGLLIGGFDSTSSTAQSAVVSVQYLGDQTLSGPILQPSLPLPVYFASAGVTTSAVVVAGGQTSPTTTTGTVWVASWDSNVGQVGQWSQQTSLPGAASQNVMATHGDTVYVFGGVNAGVINPDMYYTTVSNGQIASWTVGPRLPDPALFAQCVAVVGDWIIVAGGRNLAGTAFSATYHAPIAADGSLGAWTQGPDLPTPVYQGSPQWDVGVTDSAMLIIGGQTTAAAFVSKVQILETSPLGVANVWKSQNYGQTNIWQVLYFLDSDTTWTMITPSGSSAYFTSQALKAPLVSVPLPATGLTPGTKYHIYIHQMATNDPSSYVQFGIENGAFPDAFLFRPVYTTGAWSTDAPYSLNMTVYDKTEVGSNLLHVWADQLASTDAAQVMTFAHGPQNQIIGVCDSTLFVNPPLNSNPTFTTGVSPWTATGGTITQSNAHVQGGLPFSGLLTPDGVTANPHASSEKFPVVPTRYLVSGWVYSTNGFNVSMSINWYDSSSAFISTSTKTVAVPAAVFTFLSNSFAPPAGAAFAAITPTYSGTPTAANTLYLSNVTQTIDVQEAPQLSTVQQVIYDPATGLPTSTVLL